MEESVAEVSAAEVGTAEVAPRQVALLEVSPTEISPTEIRSLGARRARRLVGWGRLGPRRRRVDRARRLVGLGGLVMWLVGLVLRVARLVRLVLMRLVLVRLGLVSLMVLASGPRWRCPLLGSGLGRRWPCVGRLMRSQAISCFVQLFDLLVGRLLHLQIVLGDAVGMPHSNQRPIGLVHLVQRRSRL